jgi:hypothetical protein
MINYKNILKLTSQSSFLLLALPFAPTEAATTYQAGKAVKVLGSQMGAEVNAGTTGAQQTTAAVSINSLGTVFDALFAVTNPPNTFDGTTYNEVYSFGKRVFADAFSVSSDGATLRVGLAPTQVKVPFIVYPVGPVILDVSGGARFQANLTLENATTISIPIQYSEPGMKLSALASASGFVQGEASAVFISAGVGGQVDLVDAKLDVHSRYLMETKETTVDVAAIAQFLKGRIYAFVDLMGIFGLGETRIVDKNLYSWKGYCVAAGNKKCP